MLFEFPLFVLVCLLFSYCCIYKKIYIYVFTNIDFNHHCSCSFLFPITNRYFTGSIVGLLSVISMLQRQTNLYILISHQGSRDYELLSLCSMLLISITKMCRFCCFSLYLLPTAVITLISVLVRMIYKFL